MQIDFTVKNYRCFSQENPLRFSVGNGFTAFVGPNNSGKSSILKFLFEFRRMFNDLGKNNILSFIRGPGSQSLNFPVTVFDPNEIFFNSNNQDIEIDIRINGKENIVDTNLDSHLDRAIINVSRQNKHWSAEIYSSGELLRERNTSWVNSEILQCRNKKLGYKNFMKALSDLHDTLYFGPFRNAINVGTNENYFDISIGEAFIKSWRNYKTGNVALHNEAAFRLTEDIKRIFGFDSLEINPSEDNKTLQIFIDGKSYKLPELGAGISQFIIVLTNAVIKNPSFILIDEPELNLHPSLQLDFLTTLASYSKYGVLFATHSVGLARASAEKIYSVQVDGKKGSKVTPFESTPRVSEFLGELSFSGFKEMGFDKVLLVEGTTDVKTIQQFLRFYKKEHQVVLIPVGGSKIIKGGSEDELIELKRISENIFALIDSERSEADKPLDKNRQNFKEICDRVGIELHVLKKRAIENYLTDTAVKKIKGEKYQALGPYELLKAAKLPWSKSDNWRIAREMEMADLEDSDLGDFLEKL